jgi:hypothetical protein
MLYILILSSLGLIRHDPVLYRPDVDILYVLNLILAELMETYCTSVHHNLVLQGIQYWVFL